MGKWEIINCLLVSEEQKERGRSERIYTAPFTLTKTKTR